MTISEMWGLLAEIDPRVWIGAITAFIVHVTGIMLINKGIIFSGKKKRLEKAKALGNVMQGTLVKVFHRYSGEGKRKKDRYVSYYEYELNGKIRTKILYKGPNPPATVKLYYTKSPRRVFTERDVNPGCLADATIYLIPLIAAIFIMRLLGYQPQ